MFRKNKLVGLQVCVAKVYQKEKNTKYESKKKIENKERFLKDKANRQKQCNKRKRADNEELFLEEQANRRNQCN